jgi:hypothetical protein
MSKTLKKHVCLKDAKESARKRSLFANLKSGQNEYFEVRTAPDGSVFSGTMSDFSNVSWPMFVGYCNGYRYEE